jgi:hypothetical protein
MGLLIGVQTIEKLEYIFKLKLWKTNEVAWFIETKDWSSEQAQGVMERDIKED